MYTYMFQLKSIQANLSHLSEYITWNSVEQWWRLEPIPAWKKYPLMATQRVETYVIAILNHFARVLISHFYLLGRLLSVNPHQMAPSGVG